VEECYLLSPEDGREREAGGEKGKGRWKVHCTYVTVLHHLSDFDCKNHAALDADMREVVCSVKEHLQHQDGTESLQLRQLLFDFVSLNPSSSFTSAFMPQKAMCSFTHLFLTLIAVADRCAEF
jgi:hypothetical protein